MKPLTREWVEKAEMDYRYALKAVRARKDPNYDLACFLAQQCAEKYMKAVLQEASETFDRTHDLSVLLARLTTVVNRLWGALEPAAAALTDYAVRIRYPGNNADKETAKSAVRDCEFIRDYLRTYLVGDGANNHRKAKRGRKGRR